MTRALLSLVLLLLVGSSLATPAAAQARRCGTALADAEEHYRSGYFDRAIERLDACLDADELDAEERRQAYRLIGLSYIGKDREQEAREAIRALLEVAPDYQPDPALDPPPFVEMVAEVKRQRPATPGGPQPAAQRLLSTNRGFQGALRGQGTSYSDDGGSLSGGGAEVSLGYGLSPTLAVLLKLGGSSLGDGVSVGNAGLGGRFHLGGGQRRLVPFLGAGAVFQTATVESGGLSADFSGPGGEVEAGLLYFLSPSLALDGGVSALFSSLENNAVGSFSATTVNVGFGVSWRPGQ
jgi:tetratricopeptide (TPR) repeat protein